MTSPVLSATDISHASPAKDVFTTDNKSAVSLSILHAISELSAGCRR